MVPTGVWDWEVCSPRFATKVGLAEHKILKHLVRNVEQIAASHPAVIRERGLQKGGV